MKTLALYIPTTRRDLLRRSALRIGFCAVPYLLLAWLWSSYRDERLFHGWWFWVCVWVIPAGGFTLDLWRLRQTARGGNINPTVRPRR